MKLTLLAASAAALFGTVSAQDYDVVIVGAGIGGLGTARRIMDKDSSKKVVILEAQSRTGGRVYTSDKLLGKPSGASDIGASWIHQGGADHPIKILADRAGIQTVETPQSNYVYWSDTGVLHSEEDADAAMTKFTEMMQQVRDEADADQEAEQPDRSVESYLDNETHKPTFQEPLVQAICVDNLEFQYGASVRDLSAQAGDDDKQFDGPELVWPGGYSQLTDALQSGKLHTEAGITGGSALDVKLSDPVTKVEKAASGIITVTTKSGKTYTAKKVVMNVSLGVLKAKAISFSPALAAEKQASIDNLGFGNVVKLFLKMTNQFWPKDTEHMFMVRTPAESTDPIADPIDETHRGMFREFVNTAVVTDQPTLISFAIGGAADVAELPSGFNCGKDKTRCVNAAVNSLKAIFPEETVAVANSEISSWRTNEFFRGAYTYLKPGATFDDVANVAAHDWNHSLYFVGEHTSTEKYIGTVHGAYLSGVRTGNDILGIKHHEASSAGRCVPAWLSML